MRHEKIKIQIQGSAYYGWLYTYLWDNSRELYDGRKRPIVLLCPGGGYEMTSDREAEAMAYLVAPNSAVALWDSNSPTIYLKQADASGKPSIKVYDLVERTSGARTAQAAQGVEFATKADLEALAARVDALAAPKTTAKKNAKEDAE